MNQIVKVPFHGQDLTVIVTSEGEFAPVRPFCEALGLDWKSQYRKLMADQNRWSVVMMTTETGAGDRESICIPRSKVCGWLLTISPSRVNPELRPVLELYQAEADRVLDAHFRLQQSRLTTEVARLHGEAAQLRAFLLSCHPLWAKIANLQKAGVPVYMLAYHLRRGQNETFEMVRHMEKLGIIENRNWWRFEPEADEPEADEAGAAELAGVSHG